MTIEPEPLSSQSSPTTGGSSTVRYDSYVPRFGEHQEWNVMYENEDWPIFDAARKAVDIKAKHFNESFAEANHLRHMLYGHRDIDQIMDLVKKMLVCPTDLWGSVSAPGVRHLFFDHSPPVPVFATLHQTTRPILVKLLWLLCHIMWVW